MSKDMEQVYDDRMKPHVTPMRNEKPDMIAIRPFMARFTPKYAGYACQDVAHDGNKVFEADVKTAKDSHWEAVIELAHEGNYKPARPLRESLKMSRAYVRQTMGY